MVRKFRHHLEMDQLPDIERQRAMREIERQRAMHEAFDLISIKEVADVLGVCVRTARRLQAAGKAPPRVKHGRKLMYRKSELGAWPKAKARDAH